MLKKLRKTVAKILPGDSEKYLGTALALATGNPLFAGIGALADPDAGFGDIAAAAFLASQSPGLKFGGGPANSNVSLIGAVSSVADFLTVNSTLRHDSTGSPGRPDCVLIGLPTC